MMIATALGGLIGLMALAIPVAASLVLLGIILTLAYSPLPVIRAIGEISWTTSNEFILVAVPIYVLMGEILMRTGIAEKMYAAAITSKGRPTCPAARVPGAAVPTRRVQAW
jgi:TRAP-type mannitol/chloroaromatic compound transport system permease large subunit